MIFNKHKWFLVKLNYPVYTISDIVMYRMRSTGRRRRRRRVCL